MPTFSVIFSIIFTILGACLQCRHILIHVHRKGKGTTAPLRKNLGNVAFCKCFTWYFIKIKCFFAHTPLHTYGVVKFIFSCRMCTLGTACDMVEYEKDSGRCRFFPHTSLKRRNTYDVMKVADEKNKRDIYVLQCSPAQENLLRNNDFSSQSSEGEMSLDQGCSTHTCAQGKAGIPWRYFLWPPPP